MKKIFLIIIVAVTAFSCSHKTDDVAEKKASSGKTCEMLVAADKTVFTGETEQLIRSIFSAPQDGLMTGDPMFDIINIPLSSFHNTEMFHVHRNVLVCDVKEGNANKVYRYIDNWSAPQIVYEVVASDRRALDSLITIAAPRMIEDMRDGEHRRVIKAFLSTKGVKAMHTIEDKYGFKLSLSEEFEVAVQEDDFAWIRKETKDFGIGVFIHTLPYTKKSQFDTEEILNSLDTMMRHHVPGPAEGSYMGLERTNWDFTRREVTLAGQYAVEIRGMWRTFGDFMGGPLVSYTLMRPDTKELLILTAYAYAPRTTRSMPFPKRDLLLQVESICWSLKFD